MRVLLVLLMMALTASLPLGVAKASIQGGCAGTLETGRSDAVGWIDMNTMLQLGDPEVPHLFLVVSDDGTRTEYVDGKGLVRPDEFMSAWLAPVETMGQYSLSVDGFECVVDVTANGEIQHEFRGEVVQDAPFPAAVKDLWTVHTAPFFK
jgi:hypothetical protein